MAIWKIEVTEDDIREGNRLGCYDCPVARAIERATGQQAHVYGGDVRLDDRRVLDLPAFVIRSIKDYDAGAPMEPMTFDLDSETATIEEDEDDDD